MYNATFISADGSKTFNFGFDNDVIFDMDVGDGLNANIGTAQGFSDVGESVENATIPARHISCSGRIVKNFFANKQKMRKVFTPFEKGTLYIDGKYRVFVYVEDAPSFSPVKDKGYFTMRFFAPFPYFYLIGEKSFFVGDMTKTFHFPINYGTVEYIEGQPGVHFFAKNISNAYTTITNDGDVPVPYTAIFRVIDDCNQIVLQDMQTNQYLKLAMQFEAGDVVEIGRDHDRIFYAKLWRDNVETSILASVDENSTLYEIRVGENVILASHDPTDVTVIADFTTTLTLSPAVVAVYED